jgi:molybdate transport repressor ModE-like protein
MRPQVQIRPAWTLRDERGTTLVPRLIDLLVQVHEDGSLLAACQRAGVSYRHAWGLVRQGEALFGAPLLVMARGKGSTLTPLGQTLVWADRRIAARLSPLLDSLASELELEIGKVLSAGDTPLRLFASHGFAVEQLHDTLLREGQPVELRYLAVPEALAALRDDQCDLCGVALPEGEFEAEVAARHRASLAGREVSLIHLATRRQGLMLAPGNPKRLYGVRDLARPGVRFVNRQPGSGTRLLLDLMLAREGLDAAAVQGYGQCEYTHAAVAAYVASGMADAGLGVETPARRFKLEFLPLASERYGLLCATEALDTPKVQAVRAVLQRPEVRAAIDALPGYEAGPAGEVRPLHSAAAPTRRERRSRG